MFWWSIQIAAVSLIFIFLVHHLFQFFISTLTVPKVKDLVNGNKQEYENIQRILEQDNVNNYDVDPNSLMPIHDSDAMKNELKSFLKKQLKQEIQDINSYETSTSLASLP